MQKGSQLNSSSQSSSKYSRHKFNICRIVLLTSIFWVFFDGFIIFYFTDRLTNERVKTSELHVAKEPCEPNGNNIFKSLIDNLAQKNAVLGKRDSEHLQNMDFNVKTKNQTIQTEKRREKPHSSASTAAEATSKKAKSSIAAHRHQHQKQNHVEPVHIERDGQFFVDDYQDQPHNPVYWPGENGEPVLLPEKLLLEAEKRFSENQFNIVASEMVALNRSVGDKRNQEKYNVDLPTTSIIIVYHNEGNSTLLRGLTSIVRNSPTRYIKEIILVDDASVKRDYLHGPLDSFVKTLPVPVKIIRNAQRVGLIRSRLIGAKEAVGDTLTFLDAHIEASVGWLVPLLAEIKKNRKAVPCPVIDVIADDTMAYFGSAETGVGVFDDTFTFNWGQLSEREELRRNRDKSQAFRSPAMAGGLFTIERAYFYELGSYDEGMDIWGAENLEMSFRIWMCGGTLLFSPCSHVGHIFRKVSPYSFPGGAGKIIAHNTRRVIDVWTDEYKDYLFNKMPEIKRVDGGDVSTRIKLRKDLECKSFRWYLENIFPESPLPLEYLYVGEIKNDQFNYCIDLKDTNKPHKAETFYCQDGPNQMFEYSQSKQLKINELCLDLDKSKMPSVVVFKACSSQAKSQRWNYNKQTESLMNQETGQCMTINKIDMNQLKAVSCNAAEPAQKWNLKNGIMNHLYTS